MLSSHIVRDGVSFSKEQNRVLKGECSEGDGVLYKGTMTILKYFSRCDENNRSQNVCWMQP